MPIPGGLTSRRLVAATASGFLLLVLAAFPARAEAAGGAALVVRTPPDVSGVATAAPRYSLAAVTLGDGRRAILRWNPCQVITFQVNVSAVPATRRTAVAAEIRTAVAMLSSATGIKYRYAGTTSTVPRSSSVLGQKAELVIAVTTPSKTDFDIGDGMLGYGGYRYWEWSKTAGARTSSAVAIARGWVVVDVRGLMALRGGFGPGTTRGNVFLHELAHTVGLEHVTDSSQLLYSSLRATSPRGFAAGDLDGLTRVGRAAGCIPIPSNVVTDLS